MNTAVET